MSDVTLEELASLAKRRGFIYQGSEIYGGLAGTWDYGPLGAALKRNIEQAWWKMFVDDRDDMFGLDTAILMNQKVWEASGHTETFTDPLIECNNCNSRYRVDQLVDETDYKQHLESLFQFLKDNVKRVAEEGEETTELWKYYQSSPDQHLLEEINQKKDSAEKEIQTLNLAIDHYEKGLVYDGYFPTYYLAKIIEKKCPNPKCGKNDWGQPHKFNMMLETNVGPIHDDASKSYLRPENAQGMFVNYKNVIDSLYPDLPFGLAQSGRVFRNEISPREFIFRVREFNLMEFEYFIAPANWETEFKKLQEQFYEWTDVLGLDRAKIHELEVPAEDRAHYSKRTIDFEYAFSFGTKEIGAIAYRTDFDLSNHQKHSGVNMDYTVKGTNEKFIPHVIEPTFGLDRMLLATLSEAYTVDEMNGEKRVFLKLPKDLAPVKACVSPLLKNKPELVAKAREVYKMLQKKLGNVMWDDNGNIGKRYRRQDEIGTPVCITIDFQTLEDDSVTIRDRDTAKQKRVDIEGILIAAFPEWN